MIPSAESWAIYAAAGFTVNGSKITGCDASDRSWPRSSFNIEAVDLSGEQAFTVLASNADGSRRKLASRSGATLVLQTRSHGWLDLECGGPGMQKQPVPLWNGKAYE